MGATICPPDHKHAETGTCYRWHKCSCSPCRERQRGKARENEPFRRKKRIIDGLDVRVSSVGSTRRLQGLAAAGWSNVAVAERMGVHAQNIGRIRRGDAQTVQRETSLAIARVTRELMGQEPPRTKYSVAVMNYARRFGWVSVMAWDDIDNPHERPQGVATERRRA